MKTIIITAYLVAGFATFENHGGFAKVQSSDDAVRAGITILAWWVSPEVIGKFNHNS